MPALITYIILFVILFSPNLSVSNAHLKVMIFFYITFNIYQAGYKFPWVNYCIGIEKQDAGIFFSSSRPKDKQRYVEWYFQTPVLHLYFWIKWSSLHQTNCSGKNKSKSQLKCKEKPNSPLVESIGKCLWQLGFEGPRPRREEKRWHRVWADILQAKNTEFPLGVITSLGPEIRG